MILGLSSTTVADAVARLRAASLEPVRISLMEGRGEVRTLRGRFPAAGVPVAAARDFLRRHARAFGLDADLAGLTLARRRETPGGGTAWRSTAGSR